MKDNAEENFNSIKELLEDGKFKLKRSDFEEILMSKISLEKNYKAGIRTLIRHAFACFIGGLLLSIALVLLFLFNNDLKISTSHEIISVFCLFILSVVGVLFADNFLKLLHNYKILN
jgi:hypothetical protein